MFLIFRDKVFDVSEAFLFNKIHAHVKAVLKASLRFLLLRESFVIKEHFNKTMNHVVNDGLIDSDFILLEF